MIFISPRCHYDVCINSFFPHSARIWNSVPIEYFSLTYDRNCLNSRSQFLAAGSFYTDFLWDLTLWILRSWGEGVVRGYVFVVFSYLLNICRQCQLCKFFILGHLSTYLFSLVFPCPTSEKMRVGVHWTPFPP